MESGVILATAGFEHQIRFWEAHTGVSLRHIQHSESQVNCLDISPNRRYIAVGAYTHVKLYGITSNCNDTAVLHLDKIKNVTAVGYQQEGNWLFTVSEDMVARIWDLRSRTHNCTRSRKIDSPIACGFLHPNQKDLLFGDQEGRVHCWDLAKDSITSFKLHGDGDTSVQSIAVDPEATMFAALTMDGVIHNWNLNASHPTFPQHYPRSLAHEKYGLKCLFSPDSTNLVTCSADRTAKIWLTSNLFIKPSPETKFITTTPSVVLEDDSQKWVWDCAFSKDSHYLITASSDCNARLWDLVSGEKKRDYQGHQKPITCMAFRDENF